MALPDVFVIGAPKAGSTAVHAALATHPALFMSDPKEPKYFLCDDAPPPAQRGPGDAHSRKEWIWRRDDYEALFDDAPAGALLGESTPFYLWDPAAHVRLAAAVPHARLIAVVRDPVDRAYSNWTHLWSDGYEPEADFVRATELEVDRIAQRWAPFWRYLDLGRYGEQLEHLYRHTPPEQVHLIRYRDLVDEPTPTLTGIARFLDIDPDGFGAVRGENVSSWVPDTPLNAVLRRTVQTGAWVGQFPPPQVWRTLERPLRSTLRRSRAHRPDLTVEQRAAVQRHFVDDVELLSDLTGRDFRDWLGTSGRGAFSVRRGADATIDLTATADGGPDDGGPADGGPGDIEPGDVDRVDVPRDDHAAGS
jgi:Sulfotransferase family